MIEINKIFYKIIFLIFFIFAAQAESKILSIGNSDAKVTVKVFSSLTCPHCASFHTNIYEKLKEEYIDKGLVKFEHHAFPLDLAALNAEVILRCLNNNEKKLRSGITFESTDTATKPLKPIKKTIGIITINAKIKLFVSTSLFFAA